MLSDPRYAAKWAKKKAWYADNGVLPWENGGGANGTLVTTGEIDGIDFPGWRKLAEEVLGL
jgi:hypothetical protein